ncbi:MAG: hypothetical protein ACR2G4_09125 [Pyrinomonadaceae bacterium]
MNNKTKAVVIGGAVVGILSTLPFINFVNVCCCGWAIVGGVLAAYLYVKDSPTPVRRADGAMLGAVAGGIGAAIYLVIGVPVNYVVGNSMISLLTGIIANTDPAQAEAMRQQMEASQSIGLIVLKGLFVAVLLAVFSTVGGLIGVSIFEKRKGGGVDIPLPPPPTNYGDGGTQPPTHPTGGYNSTFGAGS